MEPTLSLQVELVREMQRKSGYESCYATEKSITCEQENCCWKHDCFDDASEFITDSGSPPDISS